MIEYNVGKRKKRITGATSNTQTNWSLQDIHPTKIMTAKQTEPRAATIPPTATSKVSTTTVDITHFNHTIDVDREEHQIKQSIKYVSRVLIHVSILFSHYTSSMDRSDIYYYLSSFCQHTISNHNARDLLKRLFASEVDETSDEAIVKMRELTGGITNKCMWLQHLLFDIYREIYMACEDLWSTHELKFIW